MPLLQAKVEYPCACMLLALKNELPEEFPIVWGWMTDYDQCPLPLEITDPSSNVRVGDKEIA